MSVRRASQSFALARVSHRAARVRLAVSFARAFTAKHLPLAEPSPPYAPWQREFGSSVAPFVQCPLQLSSPLGQSVVGASHRRAAPRSQSVAGSASLHRRSLPLPVPRVAARAARPGGPLPSLRRWSLALPVPPSSQSPAPSCTRRPGTVVLVAESRSVWHPQPNPSVKRTCLRQAAYLKR